MIFNPPPVPQFAALSDVQDYLIALQRMNRVMFAGGIDGQNLGTPLEFTAPGSTTVRLDVGYSQGDDLFHFELYDGAGALTVSIDSSGQALFTGTVQGGTVRSGATTDNRIELSGGAFRGITSTGTIGGLYFDITNTAVTDIFLYHNGNQLVRFYDNFTEYWIQPTTLALGFTVGSGVTGAPNQYFDGTWKFTGSQIGFFNTGPVSQTAVVNLSTATAGASYGSNEQAMLQTHDQKIHDMLAALNLLGLM